MAAFDRIKLLCVKKNTYFALCQGLVWCKHATTIYYSILR